MTKKLKAEGKRLRTAITEIFGVQVSLSQAYEILAKSKNFPCWDALVASSNSLGQDGDLIVKTPADSGHSVIKSVDMQEVIAKITAMKSGLVVVSGYMASGKSTLMANLAQQLAKRDQILDVREISEPPAQIAGKHFDTSEDIWNAAIKKLLRSDPHLLIFDEIRNGDSAWEVVKQASQGRLVIAGLHCKSADLVVKTLTLQLEQAGRDGSALDGLVSNNQFLVVHLKRVNETEREMTMLSVLHAKQLE